MAVVFNNGCYRLNGFNCGVYSSTGATVSCWIRYDQSPTITQRPWGAANDFELRSNTEGGGGQDQWANDMYGNGSYGTTTPQLGQWYNVVCTGSDAGNFSELWVNGVREVLDTKNRSETSTYLEIGGSRGINEFMQGAMEDFRVYNRVLTQAEIETIATCDGTDGIIEGLDYWWPLNDGAPGVSTPYPVDIISGATLTVRGTDPQYAEGIIRPFRRGQR